MKSVQIIPAVNASTFSEVLNVVRRVERELKDHPHAPTHVHIDVADGTLTPNVLWHDPKDLDNLTSVFQIELHLMLDNIDTRFSYWLRPHVGRYIVQFEGCEKSRSIAASAKRIGKEFGFSLAPSTRLEVLGDDARLLDVMQLLAVSPGSSGQQMDNGTTKKITQSLRLYPTLPIAIDGGVNADTIHACASHGASRFVSASYLLSGSSIRTQYDSLIASFARS